MLDFNAEDDTTCYGRKGPDSAAALIKTFSALYKGEEEDFLRVDPKGGFFHVQSSKLGEWPHLAHLFLYPHC